MSANARLEGRLAGSGRSDHDWQTREAAQTETER